jgi:hypothetical protein
MSEAKSGGLRNPAWRCAYAGYSLVARDGPIGIEPQQSDSAGVEQAVVSIGDIVQNGQRRGSPDVMSQPAKPKRAK